MRNNFILRNQNIILRNIKFAAIVQVIGTIGFIIIATTLSNLGFRDNETIIFATIPVFCFALIGGYILDRKEFLQLRLKIWPVDTDGQILDQMQQLQIRSKKSVRNCQNLKKRIEKDLIDIIELRKRAEALRSTPLVNESKNLHKELLDLRREAIGMLEQSQLVYKEINAELLKIQTLEDITKKESVLYHASDQVSTVSSFIKRLFQRESDLIGRQQKLMGQLAAM
jgi:hypothetical protein